MAEKIVFELVSPERVITAADRDMIVLPGSEGDFAVLAGHQPVIARLRPGLIATFDADRPIERIFVTGGFAEFSADRLTVLVEQAEAESAIDRAALPALLASAAAEVTAAGEDEARGQKAQERLAYLEAIAAAS
jgi:F-type H+-transporting ATPase subunit epsilon